MASRAWGGPRSIGEMRGWHENICRAVARCSSGENASSTWQSVFGVVQAGEMKEWRCIMTLGDDDWRNSKPTLNKIEADKN